MVKKTIKKVQSSFLGSIPIEPYMVMQSPVSIVREVVYALQTAIVVPSRVIMYTIPQGKILYFVSAQLGNVSAAANGFCYMEIQDESSTAIFRMLGEQGMPINTIFNKSISYGTPLTIMPGKQVVIVKTANDCTTNGSIYGWLEDIKN